MRSRIEAAVVAIYVWMLASAVFCRVVDAQQADTTVLTPISIHLKNAATVDAFTELAKQAGLSVQTPEEDFWSNQNGAATISVDIEERNFWIAAKELLEKTGVSAWPAGNKLVLGRNALWAWHHRPITVAGPVVLAVERLSRDDEIIPAKPSSVRDELTIGLRAYLDPRVRAIPKDSEVVPDQASDEDGTSLLWPPGPAAPFSGNDGSGETWALKAYLTYPSGFGMQIAEFRGKATFLVDSQTDKWEISDAMNLKPETRSVNGYEVTLESFGSIGLNEYELKISAASGSHKGTEFLQGFRRNFEAWLKRLRLEDDNGKVMDSSGGGSQGTATKLSWSVRYGAVSEGNQKPPVPVKLIWEIPVQTREVQVPFEFTNLPIPLQ